MLPSGPPTEPSSPEFAGRLGAAGRTLAQAGVEAIYLIHGTFAGNDLFGLLTELERYAPRLAVALRHAGKRALDIAAGETGNYTPRFAARMQSALSAGAGRAIPVRLFNWSSLNNHIGRADAAVRLLDELATLAESPREGGTNGARANGAIGGGRNGGPRMLLWAHSHGGNVLAIVTNLLGADAEGRAQFFEAASTFYRGWTIGAAMAAWRRVEEMLADPDHPLRRLRLDMVCFGTPIRYGWDSDGYAKLLHVINHKPQRPDLEFLAQCPPRYWDTLCGRAGDFVQQLGIAGSNVPPVPLAVRAFMADRRLGRLLECDLPRRFVLARMKYGMRVAEEGTTLLVDYDDPDRLPFRNLLGHAPYTRSRWLPLHCELVTNEFYV